MKVHQHCTRGAISVDVDAGVVEAAKLMRAHHVGFLCVLDAKQSTRAPVGVITDRDIVVQIDALEIDPKSVKVGDVMTRNPIVSEENENLLDVVGAMRLAGVRRTPVVDAAGALTGVLAVDDVIDAVSGMLCDIAGTIRNEQRFEKRTRSS
jgi:predicted transcriptional regulator